MDFGKEEKKILRFWKKNKIFEKTLSQRKNGRIFNFYDGPPFATGSPHYGHILASTIKDVVPRYWTMKGYYVPRRWGWDCHGLPIENIVEQKLGISGKKQIEEIGIGKFNKTCRENVLTFTKEWGKMVDRIGRFIDFKNSYKTMDNNYIESVWWAIKEIYKKGLIYEGRKVLLYCPRCETPISNFEVAMDNSYKDLEEESVVIKFKVKDNKSFGVKERDLYFLAWTTTPWTLPSNAALAVSKNLDYILARQNKEFYILAETRKEILGKDFQILKRFKGKEIIGLKYEPLYKRAEEKQKDCFAVARNSRKQGARYKVLPADFVSAEEGTGIVHIAPVYGEDDYNLGLKFDLPIIPLLDSKGLFNKQAPKFIQGQYFKKADELVKQDLSQRNIIYATENTRHSYPFCWRCGAVLFYNAIPAWFINIQKIKDKLIKHNKKINWYPLHLKLGRFQKGIESAPDWTISRNRYWASPLPIWKCAQCGRFEVVGSVKELNKLSDKRIADLHRPFIDKITFKCAKCNGLMKRVPEVIDCWVESASMPFAELHYPFENKKYFKERFPAQFVSEYIAQTRAWFYVMHAVSCILFDKPPFENVVATGTILNEKGEKLSKSKNNFPDPEKVLEKYGADALRFYLMSSSVMKGEDLYFSEQELQENYQKNILLLLNVFSFYKEYSLRMPGSVKPEHILDKWILSLLNRLKTDVYGYMDNYDVVSSSRAIKDFISDVSIWYLRRSRDRFKKNDKQGVQVFGLALFELSKIMAPFTPFIAEYIYQRTADSGQRTRIKKLQSVHLEDLPKINKKFIDKDLEKQMEFAREIVREALSHRAQAGIKVRQPLNNFQFSIFNFQLKQELLDIIKEEINVKEVKQISEKDFSKLNGRKWLILKKDNLWAALDIEITPELKEQGIVREVIREIQGMRKNAGYKPRDEILIRYSGSAAINKILSRNREFILAELTAKDFLAGDRPKQVFDIEKEFKIDSQNLWLGIKRVS